MAKMMLCIEFEAPPEKIFDPATHWRWKWFEATALEYNKATPGAQAVLVKAIDMETGEVIWQKS